LGVGKGLIVRIVARARPKRSRGRARGHFRSYCAGFGRRCYPLGLRPDTASNTSTGNGVRRPERYLFGRARGRPVSESCCWQPALLRSVAERGQARRAVRYRGYRAGCEDAPASHWCHCRNISTFSVHRCRTNLSRARARMSLYAEAYLSAIHEHCRLSANHHDLVSPLKSSLMMVKSISVSPPPLLQWGTGNRLNV
jgi:hypothetical protein